ncbi:MAG: CHAP domain-containing protein [bacterium]|nr:CHAP domain-containing protein [bacterium]MDZ4247867.1 CHAP domain-containing protein [Patescibacteria group bacterium]
MRKKSSGFLFLSKFWLTAGVIALAVLSLGAAQTPPRTAAAALPAEVSKVVQHRSYGWSRGMPEHEAAPDSKRTIKQDKQDERKSAARKAAAAKPKPRPELVGSVGYAVAGGNCVNEPGVNNPGYGNPIDWPVTSQEPTVGATALFTWNHTGVVTGIWANGDVEVRHQNYYGGQSRFPRSMLRGFR